MQSPGYLACLSFTAQTLRYGFDWIRTTICDSDDSEHAPSHFECQQEENHAPFDKCNMCETAGIVVGAADAIWQYVADLFIFCSMWRPMVRMDSYRRDYV